MKTRTIEVYSINDLDESAKENALANWCQYGNYPYDDENRAVLNKFENLMPIKVTNWEYGYYNHISFELTVDEGIENLSGVRLYKWIQNNIEPYITKRKYLNHIKGKAIHSKCQREWDCLTGYCLGDTIIQPIIDYLGQKPGDYDSLWDIMNDCLHAWVYACRDDMESYYSMEYFIDTAEANSYGFDENGNFI